MRPVFGQRITQCDWCKKEIPPKTQRLDDVIKTKNFYRRIHYHPSCYAEKIEAWYDKHKNDIVVTSNNGGGHRPSDLSPSQREERTKILVRLANLTRYYRDRLQLQTPVEELTTNDLRQFNNFNLRFKECRELLEPLGGLPPRYQLMGISQSVVKEIESQTDLEAVV